MKEFREDLKSYVKYLVRKELGKPQDQADWVWEYIGDSQSQVLGKRIRNVYEPHKWISVYQFVQKFGWGSVDVPGILADNEFFFPNPQTTQGVFWSQLLTFNKLVLKLSQVDLSSALDKDHYLPLATQALEANSYISKYLPDDCKDQNYLIRVVNAFVPLPKHDPIQQVSQVLESISLPLLSMPRVEFNLAPLAFKPFVPALEPISLEALKETTVKLFEELKNIEFKSSIYKEKLQKLKTHQNQVRGIMSFDYNDHMFSAIINQ